MDTKLILKLTVSLTFLFDFYPSDSVKINSGIRNRKCPYPVLRQNGSETNFDFVGLLAGIGEIKFSGAFDKIGGSKRYCKIKCINGEWIGPMCLLDGERETSGGKGQFHPVLRSCNSRILHAKFVVSHRSKTVLEPKSFPHDSILQVRCKQFGFFKLIGDAHLVCDNGIWMRRIPTCVPTTLPTNFTDESAPPSILAKVTSGSASIEPTGELALYPGSTVHLECLFRRSTGKPEWTSTSTHRTHATGWSIDAEERNWKYRLSIYYVRPQDTGIYTCSTPTGPTNSIVLNVIEVHCDADKMASDDPNLIVEIEGSRLGQSAVYECRQGFRLKGSSSATCQANGIWSGSIPECVPIVCPVLKVENSSVELTRQDFGYGGTATFRCPPGVELIGVATLVCLLTGEWSGSIPTCKDVSCPLPPMPQQNGKLEFKSESGSSVFRVGSEILFSCTGFSKMVGSESIKCQANGVWSNSPPYCKVFCPKLEDPHRGKFTPEKTEYEAGERISLVCHRGYEASSKAKRKCLKNGTWSEGEMECRPRRKKSTLNGKRKPDVEREETKMEPDDVETDPNQTDVLRAVSEKAVKDDGVTESFVMATEEIESEESATNTKNETDFVPT